MDIKENSPFKSSYVPAMRHTRTEAERQDQQLSWERNDDTFFAAGACHILAFKFAERNTASKYSVVYLRPLKSDSGHHVYSTNGEWAFDFNGWTPEHVLLAETTKACRELDPDWSYELIDIEMDLEKFCSTFQHRPPSKFAFDPTNRAEAFIDSFSDNPFWQNPKL